MAKKVSTVHAPSHPNAGAAEAGKLIVTEHPAEGAPATAQHVQLTLDTHLKGHAPQRRTAVEDEDGVILDAEPFCMVLDEVEGLGDAPLTAPFKDLSPEERQRILVEVAQKNALQRRDTAIARLHTRRAENLLRQVEMREKRRGLLAHKVHEYKVGLRERIAVALSEEDRSCAAQELNALKKALRDIDNPLSRHDARLERMVAVYDSDKDVVESVLNNGRATSGGGGGNAATTTASGVAAAAAAQSEAEAATGGGEAAVATNNSKKRRRAPAATAAAGTGGGRRGGNTGKGSVGSNSNTHDQPNHTNNNNGAATEEEEDGAPSASDALPHSGNDDDEDDDDAGDQP